MSIASESTSYEQALTLVGEMPFADKLRFNAELASLLRKEGKSGVVGKAAKKEKKAKDPANKRSAAPGTLAWIAFVKHCKDTMPERFTECALEKERLAVAKIIKDEDKAVYDAFVAKFKEEHPAASTAASDDEAEAAAVPAALPAAPPAAPLSAKEKLEKLKAAAVKKEEKPKAEAKPKKEVKKAASKPKKEEKAKAAEDPMPRKEIDGTEYWFDPDTNGLYSIVDGGFGAWVGYFQPENKEEPIRFTESPADE